MAKKKPEIQAAREEPPKSTSRCSFCGSPPDAARFLIAGPNNIFICEVCVGVCVKMLAKAREERR